MSENTTAYKPGDYTALDAELVATAQDLIDKDGAESIVLLGAVMAGASRRIEARVPVPVLDGMRCAIPQAEALVRIGARKPTTGSYALPGERGVSNLSDALTRYFKETSGAFTDSFVAAASRNRHGEAVCWGLN